MEEPTRSDKPATSLVALIKNTNKNNPTAAALAELRLALREDDDTWRAASDLNVVARRAALRPLRPLERESVMLRAEAMQGHLGYPQATMLEQLLIEQVVTCWLHLELAQAVYGAGALTTPDAGAAKALERRVAGAQARYLKATDALVRLRFMGSRLSLAWLSAGRQPRMNQEYLEEPEEEEEQEDEMLEEGQALEE